MTKCLHCGLTLADPPNGEEECAERSAAGSNNPVQRSVIARFGQAVISTPTDPAPDTNTTPPYRAEVIDNAVLALVTGVKV